MNPFELHLKDGRTAGIFACGQCRIVHRDEARAEQCCAPYKCDQCGKEVPKYHTRCDGCRTAEHREKERKRFEAAEKVTEWDGFVCWGDDYYPNIEELMDMAECTGDELPEYVWTCDPNSFVNADLSDITERIADNAYEDFDVNDLSGLDELRAAIEKFNEANAGVLSYEVNYKRALVLKLEQSTNGV